MFCHVTPCSVFMVCHLIPCHVTSCLVMSYPVMSCLVMSCHVMSYPVMSCHVMSYPVMSHHVMSCRHVMSYPVMSRHVISCHVMSYPVMSHHVRSCHVMSYPVTSYHVLSCHVMSSGIITFHLIPLHSNLFKKSKCNCTWIHGKVSGLPKALWEGSTSLNSSQGDLRASPKFPDSSLVKSSDQDTKAHEAHFRRELQCFLFSPTACDTQLQKGLWLMHLLLHGTEIDGGNK